jgi:hypothetical protein
MFSINKNYPQSIRKYIIYPVTEGVVLALLALFLTSVTAFFIYHHALTAIEAEIKDGLLRTASGIAACLDADLIETFDSPEKSTLPEYQRTVKLLQKARLATKHCTYLYVNRMVKDKVYFILDPTPIDKDGKPLFSDEKNLAPSVPMTEYKEPSGDLITALSEQRKVITQIPYTDKWGTFYSAFIPLFNSDKQCIGVLGADLRIDDMLARCEPIEDATKRAFFVSVVLALLCGTLIWFTRRFSLQLNESRFAILDHLLETKEFAENNSEIMGRQLQRTGLLLKNMAARIDSVTKEKDPEKIKHFFELEQNRLKILSEKLFEAGELKYSQREPKLVNFSVQNIVDDLKKILESNNLDSQQIEIEVDKEIPEIFGPAKEFEEQLAQMSAFYLRLLPGKTLVKVTMKSEEAKEVTLQQKMSADIKDIDENILSFLKKLCEEADEIDFFSELELADASIISVIRELVYILNSNIEMKVTDSTFEMTIEICLPKSLEPEEESSEILHPAKETPKS